MSTAPPVIQVVSYDPEWPLRFAEEARDLTAALEGLFAEIHHIGSTSVPDLSAKPLIDVLVAVETLKPPEIYAPALASLGYCFYPLTDVTGRLLFIKGTPRTHHVHIAERGGWHYWRFLLFRDCLRSEPAVAQAYERLKRHSARLYPNSREEYTLSKTEFITSTVIRLLREHPEIVARLRELGEPLPDGV